MADFTFKINSSWHFIGPESRVNQSCVENSTFLIGKGTIAKGCSLLPVPSARMGRLVFLWSREMLMWSTVHWSQCLGGEHYVPVASLKERCLDSLIIYTSFLRQKVFHTLSCPNITCISWVTCTRQNSFVAEMQVGRINRSPNPQHASISRLKTDTQGRRTLICTCPFPTPGEGLWRYSTLGVIGREHEMAKCKHCRTPCCGRDRKAIWTFWTVLTSVCYILGAFCLRITSKPGEELILHIHQGDLWL